MSGVGGSERHSRGLEKSDEDKPLDGGGAQERDHEACTVASVSLGVTYLMQYPTKQEEGADDARGHREAENGRQEADQEARQVLDVVVERAVGSIVHPGCTLLLKDDWGEWIRGGIHIHLIQVHVCSDVAHRLTIHSCRFERGGVNVQKARHTRDHDRAKKGPVEVEVSEGVHLRRVGVCVP